MVSAPDVHGKSADSVVNPMLPALYTIQRVKRETDDTFTLELVPESDRHKISFLPGQFIMVYVFGVGEVPLSISGDAAGTVLVHTIRAVGIVTRVMSRLRRGDKVGIRGPFGTAWPVQEAQGHDVVLIAGGIGLPPLRPVLYHVLSRREEFGKVVLLYGTRTPSDILFRDELEQWRARFDLEVHVTVDRAQSGWRGNVGVVTTLIHKSSFDPQKTIAMVCGPEAMMRFSALELQRRGVSTNSIYLSMERNMKCAIGLCGHCQFGPLFVCKDGPVFRYSHIKDLLVKWEI
ncbi:MAG: Ni/Fe hydrogenase subunit gamma [Ignavibacteria bacterium]|nr:Ni/Fe hydrogenase subunit gamma [Ignavibacteria bacterium]